jgi:hypothetical protein
MDKKTDIGLVLECMYVCGKDCAARMYGGFFMEDIG